jgi:sialate O-acetylesterase
MKQCLSRSMLFASLLVVASNLPQVQADVALPKVIGSHMVLQRDRALPIWGWADPGEEVAVKLDDATAAAKADTQGNWRVMLPAVKADGKPHRMTVSGKNRIELEDILFGDVWIGSGQSNMEYGLSGCHNAKEAIAAATDSQIHLLQIEKVQAADPAKDVKAGPGWQACSPKTVPGFSGVLYFFGQRLRKEINVPVGLINSSWGGSCIEPWTVSTDKSAGLFHAGMYNGMIAPLVPFAIRGVLWYQGESNAANELNYRHLMGALIGSWRNAWGCDFPFYFVQLAPCAGFYQAASALPFLWESQAASLKIPKTGMVVTTDLVDNRKNIDGIHPKNKLDVGNRLALWALAKEYGRKDVVYSGPLYKSMKIEGDKIRLSFAHVDGGLTTRDGKPLNEFQVTGADGKFVPAEAVIDGDTVVVTATGVSSPTQVQFGWHNLADPNLTNKAGLPASPFQTNNWLGGTGE